MPGPSFFLSRRRPRSITVVALTASTLFTDCGGDDGVSGCDATSEQYQFSEETGLGYSMFQAVSGRHVASAQLRWALSRDWLEHSAAADTAVVLRASPSGDPVDEVRNKKTHCLAVLQSSALISVVSEDGQLEFAVEGTMTALSRDVLRVEADVEPEDLKGVLEVPSNVRLRFRQTIEGDSVEGVLIAYTAGDSRVRALDLATWEGDIDETVTDGEP